MISIEADALHQMAGDLPADFAGAVEAILQTKGRVIVSGVGKSGHIGNKIAATLASTGTPASFVHATEASHGDLGMVTAADFCLPISTWGKHPNFVILWPIRGVLAFPWRQFRQNRTAR